MRKSKAKKRKLLPDSKYNSLLVSEFVNNLMKCGKKYIAYNIFYDSIDIVNQKIKKNNAIEESALEVWERALENITPAVEVKSRRIGGATFQVPTEIRPARKKSIAIKNMIKYARGRQGKSMSEKLSAEILAAFNSEGGAFKRKEETHRMAEANKAFAHFRF